MVQVLHLSNGKTLNANLRNEKSRVTPLLKKDNGALIDEAYLLCLARVPSAGERKRLLAVFANAPATDRRAIVEDLFWALMTSREFLFQH